MVLEEYLKEQMRKSAAIVDKHANKKGRYHHNIWNFHMGRFCAFEQMLAYVSGKNVSEILSEFMLAEEMCCTDYEGSIAYGTKK